MSPMPIQTKIGDASLKFGPDWLRALSSSDRDSERSGSGGGGPAGSGPGGWSSGSGGGGGGARDGGSYSSAASSNQHHHQYSSSNAPHHRERLSSSSGNSPSGTTSYLNANRFQPPEFGYGREEMLALFDKNLPPPDFLSAFGTLFIEKMQPPLAFSQPSEDELRVWHVPQPESSRLSNSGPPPVGRGGFTIRGRGIGSERGRGRGRGGYYSRPHEEEDRGSFSRPRTFERSQSAHERVWAERNGGVSGPVPPPPEDGGARGGSWRTRESYGSKRYDNDDDGWRKPKWRRGDEDEDAPPRSNTRRLHKSWSDDGAHDNLPEWAKDNPSEESGTFDASGAFHEEDRYSAKSNAFEQNRRDLERSNREAKGESEPYGSQNDRVQKRTPERNDIKAVIPPSVLEEEPEEAPPEVDRLKSTRQQQSRYRSNESSNDTSNNAKVQATPLRNEESSVIQSNQRHQSSPTDTSNENLITHPTPPLPDLAENRQSLSEPQSHLQQPSVETRIPNINRNLNSLQEEHYYSMIEEADMVAKLIEDDGSLGSHSSSLPLNTSIPIVSSLSMGCLPISSNHINKIASGNSNVIQVRASASAPVVSQGPGRPTSPLSFEVWFYRDPQGSVQGPFTTVEMAQWYSQGYFSGVLLLRRECDQTFITLAEMGKMYGRNPFIVIPDSPPPPPLLDSSPSALDNLPDPTLQAQYHQRHILQQQSILREQQHQHQYLLKMNQSGIRKEGDTWSGLPQHPQFGSTSSHASSSLNQAQIQTQILLNLAKQAGVMGSEDNPIDNLQAMFNRQMQGKPNDGSPNSKNEFINPMMQPQLNTQMDMRKSPTQASPDPIQSLVQQLANMTNSQHSQQTKLLLNKQKDTVSHWGTNPSASSVQQQVGGWPNQPQGTNQMWEYREQFMKLQQQKLEGELLRQKKEEEQDRKRIMEEDERKQREEQQRFEVEEHEKNRKLMEEQYMLQKKQEELIKQQQAADLARQKELLLQQQRLHQQELERQQQQFEQKRLEQQRLEQQRLEQQRLEQQRLEQQRLEQQRLEQQRLEQQRQEQQRQHQEQQRIEQKMRQEQQEREERRIQLELEEQLRIEEHDEKQRQHQLRMQEEHEAAKQQELQQKFSWISSSVQQVQPTDSGPPAMSLLEIQQEEAIKEHENAIRQQAAKKNKQIQQQEQARLQREAKSGLSLKWAQPAQPQKVAIKSFAEIQAEEQDKLAKQQEKDREHRAIVSQHTQLQQAWSSSLTWANRASLNAPPSTPKLNGGIWDDPPTLAGTGGGKQAKSVNVNSINSSPLNTGATVGNVSNSNKQATNAQQGHGKRGKESDEAFLKLFQEHGMNMKTTRTQSQNQPQDEFTRWCCDTVEGIGGGSVDIATFVSFLKEVESPYEVNDYVRSYLGDGRDAREFGKEFLERRSRWKNARKDQDKEGGGFEDNLCRPAYAVNPTQSEFQEVKVKGKKGKKGKMQKVDSRILGFNTTSAPDRVNVGKRDYGDGTD